MTGDQEAAGPVAAEFDATIRSYYRAWFRYHCEEAVEAGVPGFDDRLSPYDDDDVGALITLHEKLLDSLDEFNVGALDPDRRIDARLVAGSAFIEMEELMEADWRRRDPARFIPVNAVYQLLVRPVRNLAGALLARLQAVPVHLRGARRFLAETPEAIPRQWVESAITEARSGCEFLRLLTRHPLVVHEARRLRGIEVVLNEAVQALDGFAGFMERELLPRAAGDFACGRRRFEHLLQHRHFLDVDADRLHRFGSDLFAQIGRELDDASRALAEGDGRDALSARIRADHPSADALLGVYAKGMQAARGFLERHDVVSLPEHERLLVVETPGFLRHRIPFAAYMEPAPNDPAQRAYYYVTPAHDEDLLSEHNHAAILHTCVHEAWPGHHLQFVIANRRRASSTLPRYLNPSATLYEGWALYCEQLMSEEGFLDRDESRFILLRDRLWRALRVIIDVEIHTRGLTLEAAADRMVRDLGFAREQALADLAWYTRSPTVPMGYAAGWALINAARDQVRLAERDQFSVRSFHDRLLSAGSIALPIVLQKVFGPEVWTRARNMVFAG